MPSPEIQRLVDAVEAAHGPLEPYGSDLPAEHSTSFKVAGVPAHFSVLTLDGSLPLGRYDVQIESSPPGDYLYADEVSLEEFLQLVSKISGPEEGWPSMEGESS